MTFLRCANQRYSRAHTPPYRVSLLPRGKVPTYLVVRGHFDVSDYNSVSVNGSTEVDSWSARMVRILFSTQNTQFYIDRTEDLYKVRVIEDLGV